MTSGAREQFANFNAAIAKVGIDLIPMVDVETSDKQSVREVKDSLMVFVNLVKEMYGVNPMIYGTNRSYNELCAPDFNHLLIYIGRYGENRPVVKGPSHYYIWQYSETGSIDGIPKPVDLCRFHKDADVSKIDY
jgi:lysozyme